MATVINPHAADSYVAPSENSRAYYATERRLTRSQRAQACRQKLSKGWWEGQRRIDRCHRRIKGLRSNTYESTGSLAMSGLLYAVCFLPRTLPPTSAKSLIKKTSITGLHRHCNAMTRYAMINLVVAPEADHAARSIPWLY